MMASGCARLNANSASYSFVEKGNQMKTSINKFLGLVCLTVCLVGCVSGPPPEPTVFDMPQSQWNTLTSEQQNEVIRGYNERKQKAEANAPFIAAMGAFNSVANQALANQRDKEKQKTY